MLNAYALDVIFMDYSDIEYNEPTVYEYTDNCGCNCAEY